MTFSCRTSWIFPLRFSFLPVHRWLGVPCSVKHACDCALNSLYVDKSVCVCPVDQYGPRCYLHEYACRKKPCSNGGQCIAGDERRMYSSLNNITCICRDGYFGDRCEFQESSNQIEISFDRKLIIPSLLIIHFITVEDETEVTRISVIKKVPVHLDFLLFHTN
ncbi:unnamed protein product [Rotaria magnacalcarata]